MTTTEPAIADHGLIGDLQTAALVSTDGSVDWFCAPRFDGPSVFAALLDHERGGHLTVRPAEPYTSRQMYFPDTAVLVTRFATASGLAEVMDLMPVLGTEASDRHRIVRLVRCTRGRVRFTGEIAPRFDYGRRKHEVHLDGQGAVFVAGADSLTVHPVREADDARLAEIRGHNGGDVELTVELAAGQTRGVVVEYSRGEVVPAREIRPAEVQAMLDDTVAFWQRWVGRSTYRGRWREMVHRSAITLKLMTYAPTGGLVAAPTAALPEQVGGERNWDYRYTWVRDASFSVQALLRLGLTDEAAAFGTWLGNRIRERAGTETGEGGPLSIMYRIDGTADLKEEVLTHWSGYRGSYPVRIGNGAAGQLQLDIYGEALDSLYAADRAGLRLPEAGWTAVRGVLDWLTLNWDRPEEGIWETRGGRQAFTYGRLMSWVALDRGVRLAAQHGLRAPLARWTDERDRIREQVLARGWHADRKAFVQHYDTHVLDASLLRLPRVGFLAANDPQWLSTLTAMDTELVTDGLVHRYDPAASPDGLRGSEGTFTLCSFGYVDALARAGLTDRARYVFDTVLTHANHLGLYSEEIAPTGEQIGNFPQAFTHLALVDAAVTLDRALNGEAIDR